MGSSKEKGRRVDRNYVYLLKLESLSAHWIGNVGHERKCRSKNVPFCGNGPHT